MQNAAAILASTLLLFSAQVSALSWPWSEPDIERMEYCKGLVTGGLSSQLTAGEQRSDLWLAWNYLIRTGGVGHSAAPEQFAQGHAVLTEAADADTATARLDEFARECGLNRSGMQVTGF